MTAIDDLTAVLEGLGPEIFDPSLEGMAAAQLAERIGAARRRLAPLGDVWIEVREAKRLLAVTSPEAVLDWVGIGLLRAREFSPGHVQVLLDDVLNEREQRAGLGAIGGRDLTEDELEVMYQARPGTAPWEREHARTGE